MLAMKSCESSTNGRAPPAFSAIHAKPIPIDLQSSSSSQPSSPTWTATHDASRSTANRRLRGCPVQGLRHTVSAHSISNSKLTDPPLQRNIPTRGLKPAYYLLGVGLVMAYGWRKIFIGAREKKYAPLECPPALHLSHSTSPPAPQLSIVTHALITDFPNTASSPARKCGHGSTLPLSSKPKKTATKHAGTLPTKLEKRNFLALRRAHTIAIGTFRAVAYLKRTDSEAATSTAAEPCCVYCARRIKADMFCLLADSSGQHSCTRPQK
jgi:hypothetical protein